MGADTHVLGGVVPRIEGDVRFGSGCGIAGTWYIGRLAPDVREGVTEAGCKD